MATQISAPISLADALSGVAQDVNTEMDRLLSLPDGPEDRVVEAMRYSALGGGKRLRPFLVMESSRLFNVSHSSALRVAAAIEMVHCYSLIHDDLPCMDDDDLRRGQPTCHRKFDEATAVLAGDALLTKAFEVVAAPATHSDPAVRCELVWELAHSSGSAGMVGGQMVDLRAQDLTMDVPAITRLQQMKTGRLFEFSCVAGAILAKAAPQSRQALKLYSHDLGLAFQIADDLLDVEGDAGTVGKRTGKDAEAGKATFVSLMGVERARAQARILADQAVGHLDVFDEKADHLRATARFVVDRSS